METLTVELATEKLSELKRMATKLDVTPEELVRISVEAWLAQPDELFDRATAYVLEKNLLLYQRLA